MCLITWHAFDLLPSIVASLLGLCFVALGGRWFGKSGDSRGSLGVRIAARGEGP